MDLELLHLRIQIWSHLILGGWDVDTSKRVVEKDVEAFLGEFKITGLQRHAVFGPRTRVAHRFLQNAPESTAKSRFFEMLPRINKVFKLSNNSLMWIFPKQKCGEESYEQEHEQSRRENSSTMPSTLH